MFPRGVCLSSCPPGPLLSGSDPSGYGSRDSNLLSFRQMELGSSAQCSGGHLSMRLHPLLDSYDQDDCSLNNAKRARVENTIRGMICTDAGAAADQESYQEELQHAVVHHRPENTGEEQETGQHLHLRRSFSHILSDCGREEKPPFCSLSAAPPAGDEGLLSRRCRGWRKVKPRSFFQSRPEGLQLMADVFKSELSRAVSRSVDAIFRSMPLLPASEEDADAAPQAEKKWSSFCCGAADVHVPDVQTEALSLVVQRPDLERSAAPRHPKPPSLLCHDAAEGEEQRPGRSSSAVSGLQDAEPRREAPWRPKVNSRSVRSPHQAAAVEPLPPESRCPPGVKMESDGVLRSHLYAVNEGLTANHLKKAKLMFFYTRYPSSLVLRTCFHDVQFSRCIASQLIKWFSNFREFYYIQMEKWARAALLDLRDLTVGRESELFRALNMHYNKANDFQVPDCFLEVAEVTLREFYAAISLGKDRDPSWKKAIYKVICKLDTEVPAEFRGHLGV
ncbi:prospero homeobox protein 1 [Oryzias latipes]|uniref:prospero homeobox protein 1 n=1 Tax=Oryzias latipes TaxID=8090 RepID=UPI0009DA53CF|nr:prospero homeobox protein 1 [Oryzias latipes]